MVEALGFLLVIAAGLFVIWPLRVESPSATREADDETINAMEQRRLVLYRDIADLDFEHELGRVTEEDYSAERDAYVDEAAALLESLDNAASQLDPYDSTSTPDADERLEQEIRRLRARSGRP